MGHCIVVLSYNHPELTKKAVNSAMQFALPIILIHNGSNERNIFNLKESYPQIEHLIIKNNAGWTNGVNLGLTFAFKNYSWVFLITNDTEILTLGDFPIHPSFVAPLIYFRKITKIDSMGGIFTPHLGHLRHIKKPSENQIKKRQYFYVPGTAFLIHRDLFLRVGKFDESLHTYWEDVDYSVRANILKESVYYDENFSLLHKVGKTCHDNPFYTTYLFKRNRKKIALKYANGMGKIIFLAILMKEIIEYLFKYQKTKDKIRLKLFLNAIKD